MMRGAGEVMRGAGADASDVWRDQTCFCYRRISTIANIINNEKPFQGTTKLLLLLSVIGGFPFQISRKTAKNDPYSFRISSIRCDACDAVR